MIIGFENDGLRTGIIVFPDMTGELVIGNQDNGGRRKIIVVITQGGE